MINVDGLTQMVKESPDYKVVVKGGVVHVIPADAIDKIDFSRGSTALDMNSAIILRGDGRAKKSRWTNVAEDCPCEIKRRLEEQQDNDYSDDDFGL